MIRRLLAISATALAISTAASDSIIGQGDENFELNRMDVRESEAKIRQYFQMDEIQQRHRTVWNTQKFRQKRAALKRVRRAHIVRCCGGGCDGPASSALEMRPTGGGGKRNNNNATNRAARRKVNYEVLGYNPLNNKLFIKRKNKPARQDGAFGGGSNKAVAKLVRGGISITCPRCPADWQNQLRLGNRVGTIPVVCPGCAPNWREYLPQDFKMTTVKDEPTTKEEEEEEDDEEKETGSTKASVEDFGSEIEVVTDVADEDGDAKTEETTSAEETSTEEATTVEETTTTEATSTTVTSTTTTAAAETTTAKAAIALPAGLALPPGINLAALLG